MDDGRHGGTERRRVVPHVARVGSPRLVARPRDAMACRRLASGLLMAPALAGWSSGRSDRWIATGERQAECMAFAADGRRPLQFVEPRQRTGYDAAGRRPLALACPPSRDVEDLAGRPESSPLHRWARGMRRSSGGGLAVGRGLRLPALHALGRPWMRYVVVYGNGIRYYMHA